MQFSTPTVALATRPVESVAEMMIDFAVELSVGVPLMRPELVEKVTPAGSAALTSDATRNVTGPVSPAVVKVTAGLMATFFSRLMVELGVMVGAPGTYSNAPASHAAPDRSAPRASVAGQFAGSTAPIAVLPEPME